MPTSPARKWLVAAAKLAVLALVVWFVQDTLVDAWRQLGKHPWRVDPGWLAATGAFYLLGLLPAGLFWWYLLRVMGQPAAPGEALRAYFIGHLGKYVPGKAMVVVLRAGLIRGRHVDVGVAAASVFAETLTMMAVGAVLAAGTLAIRLSDERALFWGALGLALLAGLPTLPPIFRRVARLAGVGRNRPEVAKQLDRLNWAVLGVGWLAMLASWCGLAASLWAMLRALGLDVPGLFADPAAYIAAVSLSMVAGFLSLIPGGLGVRDMILLRLLARLFPLTAAEAVVAGVLLRLTWLISELVLSALLYLLPGVTSCSRLSCRFTTKRKA